ncbi:hypothetical protein [Hufsiella arboris]|nr:hypothetical protein [Hufsiella arboris]
MPPFLGIKTGTPGELDMEEMLVRMEVGSEEAEKVYAYLSIQ